MWIYTDRILFVVCSRLEEINVDEPTKEELELILHILMDCTKYSPSPLISSQGQTPVQPADRSVTQSVLNTYPTQQHYLHSILSSSFTSYYQIPWPWKIHVWCTHGYSKVTTWLTLLYWCVGDCINDFLLGICRVSFLLELALLALQVKHQEVAANCLKELKSAGEAVSVRYSLNTSGCYCTYHKHMQMCAGIWHPLWSRHLTIDEIH